MTWQVDSDWTLALRRQTSCAIRRISRVAFSEPCVYLISAGCSVFACTVAVAPKTTPNQLAVKDLYSVIGVAMWAGIAHEVGIRCPSNVLKGRNRFQMVRSDTVLDATQMVKVETFWDGPDCQFVAESVGEDTLVLIRRDGDPEVAVATRMEATAPQPTAGRLFDLGPEPFLQRNHMRHEPSLVPGGDTT